MSSAPVLQEEAWEDLLQAADFVERRFEEWAQQGRIRPAQLPVIRDAYADRRRRWQQRRERGDPPHSRIGLPPKRPGEPAALTSYRFLVFLGADLRNLRDDGHLRRAQADELLAEVRERQDALSRRIAADDVPEALPVSDEEREELSARAPGRVPPPPPPPPRPREPRPPSKPLIEVVLDPANIQWLLAFGGGMMVVGLVILMWVNKMFTPALLAGVLGVANLALLVGGWVVIRGTRYHLAGRAMTLLACLVMPLNLWYWQANGFMNIDGHLWVAGIVVCALYAASAVVLREEPFVYVLVAGVAGAGLLAIASWPPVGAHFFEVVAPATLLVVLGLVCIHAERAFPDDEGPFTRKRFGLAFFWSGHIVMAAGLLLVLAAFVSGKWLYEPYFRPMFAQYGKVPSSIVGEKHWLALLLVLVATYAYVYSDLVVRRVGVYVYVAAMMMLWAIVLVLEELQLRLGVDVLIGILAVLGLVVNLAHAQMKGNESTRALPILGVLLPLIAVLVGLERYASSTPDQPLGIGYIVAIALTAISCRIGAFLYRESAPGLAAFYFFTTAAATLVGSVVLLNVMGLYRWEDVAPIVMIVPILYVVFAAAYRGGPSAAPLLWTAHAAAGVMILSSLAKAAIGFTVVQQSPLNLKLALFAFECAVFYSLAAFLHRQSLCVYLAAVLSCGVVWQLFNYAGLAPEYYALVFGVVGLGLLIGYRFALFEGLAGGPLSDASFAAGNALLTLAFIASGMLAAGRLLAPVAQAGTELAALCLILTVFSIVAVFLVSQRGWRRWYVVTSIAEALLAFLVITLLSDLRPMQKMQIFSVSAGLVLLVAGHIGWYRERERDDDLVSMGLFFGSLLAGVPMAVAALNDRAAGVFLPINEIGFLVIPLLLMTTGVLFRIRATTVIGTLLTALYFITLLMFVPWGRLNAVALIILIGGGVLFGLGLVLSVFREHLLTLPERIKNREGVFRVLSWR